MSKFVEVTATIVHVYLIEVEDCDNDNDAALTEACDIVHGDLFDIDEMSCKLICDDELESSKRHTEKDKQFLL